MARVPKHISQEDWDDSAIPEWTDEDFSRAIRFKNAHPEVYAEWEKQVRGASPFRPPNTDPDPRDVNEGDDYRPSETDCRFCCLIWVGGWAAITLVLAYLIARQLP